LRPRFKDDQALGLEKTRQGERVASSEKGPFLRLRDDAQESHAIRDSEFMGSGAQGR
jgi:hypothetical protein